MCTDNCYQSVHIVIFLAFVCRHQGTFEHFFQHCFRNSEANLFICPDIQRISIESIYSYELSYILIFLIFWSEFFSISWKFHNFDSNVKFLLHRNVLHWAVFLKKYDFWFILLWILNKRIYFVRVMIFSITI